ncbi:MAG: DOMON domain-containing protein [Planctomycetota bacterium]
MMMNKTIIVVAVVLALIVFSCSKGEEAQEKASPAAQPAQAASIAGGGFMLKAADVDFTWNIQGDKLSVKLAAPTTGWIGVGFNPTEEMKDANFIIGFVKDGEVSVLDQFGTAKRKHKEDSELGGTDNLSDTAGSETASSTEISFTMPLKSGDAMDREILPQADQVVLLAYGNTDRLAQQHVANAKLKVNLSTGSYQVLKISE